MGLNKFGRNKFGRMLGLSCKWVTGSDGAGHTDLELEHAGQRGSSYNELHLRYFTIHILFVLRKLSRLLRFVHICFIDQDLHIVNLV